MVCSQPRGIVIHMTAALAKSSRERLSIAVDAARQSYWRLEALITTSVADSGNVGSRQAPHSKPPWNTAAAVLILDFTREVRAAELRLRLALQLPIRLRGGSDKNTMIALGMLKPLAEAAGDGQAMNEASWLEKWDAGARRALGEASQLTRLPRQPGERERPCPFCVCFTLRYLPLHGVVKCVNPGCRDEEGRRPTAKIEWSEFTESLELIWHDGVSGLPPAAEKAKAS
jgi:hypothetical protein